MKISFRERFDRVLKGGFRKQLKWFVSITLAILLSMSALTLLFPCDAQFFGLDGYWSRMRGVIYHFLDPGNLIMEADGPIGIQIFSIVVALLGMGLLSGLLITTLTNIVDRRVSEIDEGNVVYSKITDHYVIIGYGEIAVSIVRNIQGHRILILTNQDIPNVRRDLMAQLPPEYEDMIYFYAGSIDSVEHLSKLNIQSAKEVYVLGENDDPGRESKNLACVKSLAQLRGTGKEILTVNVRFDKTVSYSVIQKLNLTDEFLFCQGERVIYFRPFNSYENWARILWGYNGKESYGYDKLDYDMIEDDKYVHLVIVGFGNMGRALFFEALRQCHYPSYNETPGPGEKQIKTRITVVDKSLSDILPEFKAQYPYLDQIVDVDIEYKSVRVEDDLIREMLVAQTHNPDALLTVAICIEDPDVSLSIGLSLPDDVYYTICDGKVKNTETRILIRQSVSQVGIGALLQGDNRKFSHVRVFGMTDTGVSEGLMNDDLAMYVNAYYTTLYTPPSDKDEVGRTVMLYFEYLKSHSLTGEPHKEKSFIDWVLAPEHHQFMHEIARRLWMVLSESHRFANRYQIDMFHTYLKYIGSPVLDQMEHLRWNADRSIVGYRDVSQIEIERFDYKALKDIYKFHVDIIPFKDLPSHEEKKDSDVIINMKKLMGVY